MSAVRAIGGILGKIIAIVNQKGGVGKTTTTVNLAASLATADQKVLVVDFDPQGNASSSLGAQPSMDADYLTIYNAISGQCEISKTIRSTELDHLDVVPANSHLTGAEIELVGAFARETKLKFLLAEVKAKYDYILIDCPPTLGLLTVNALTAADSVLIPLQAEYFALEGLSQLMTTVGLVRQSVNPQLEIEGILLTMFNNQLKLSLEVEKEVRTHFSDKVFNTMIPRNIKLSECTSFGKPVILYDVNSKGAVAYLDLARELLQKQVKLNEIQEVQNASMTAALKTTLPLNESVPSKEVNA